MIIIETNIKIKFHLHEDSSLPFLLARQSSWCKSTCLSTNDIDEVHPPLRDLLLQIIQTFFNCVDIPSDTSHIIPHRHHLVD